MNINKIHSLLAVGTLVISMLACSFGKGQDSSETVSPQAAANENTPATEVPEVPADNSSSSAGACDNPYMPIVAGAAWNYKLTGPIPDTFTRSITSVEAGGFSDQDVFGTGVTRQSKWNCDNGNLIALNPADGGSSTVNTEDNSVDFQTTASSGVTMPANLNVGDTWTQAITLEGIQTINGTEIPSKNNFSNTCTAVGVESVTVEAGTFDAMRVECQTVMDITITMQGNPIQQNLTFNGINWYAKNIGLVKTAATGDGLDTTTELTSYNIP